jgi:hypothetical protein
MPPATRRPSSVRAAAAATAVGGDGGGGRALDERARQRRQQRRWEELERDNHTPDIKIDIFRLPDHPHPRTQTLPPPPPAWDSHAVLVRGSLSLSLSVCVCVCVCDAAFNTPKRRRQRKEITLQLSKKTLGALLDEGVRSLPTPRLALAAVVCRPHTARGHSGCARRHPPTTLVWSCHRRPSRRVASAPCAGTHAGHAARTTD